MKIKVLHQVLDPSGAGGVSAEYRALQNSRLSEKYDFDSMILSHIHRGINIKDIRFYYSSIKSFKPDIVHVRGAAVDGLNAVIAARLAGHCKVLTTVHGMYSDLVFISPIKRWVSKNIIERAIFMLSHGISCVCKSAMERQYFDSYRSKMLPFVYNRIPNYDISKRSKVREGFLAKYGLYNDDIICVYVGRMTREKGLVTLEKVFELYDFPKKLVFLFVGDGDYKTPFEKKCSSYNVRAIFTGMQKDVMNFYLASDFFIQPSLHENHSISLLEACAAGIPSVATNCGGNPEIIDNNVTGKLVPVDSPKNLYDAIIEMCNPTIRSGYSENISREQYSRFSNNDCDAALDRVYQLILKR